MTSCSGEPGTVYGLLLVLSFFLVAWGGVAWFRRKKARALGRELDAVLARSRRDRSTALEEEAMSLMAGLLGMSLRGGRLFRTRDELELVAWRAETVARAARERLEGEAFGPATGLPSRCKD